MGGGRLSFRMGLPATGIEVHYVNVDLLASGPPAALFDDTANESTSGNFESSVRFGSNGPTIYDYVLISIPYTEGSSSQAGLNESEPINVSRTIFYDDDWNVIWNTSVNGTSGANLAGNFSHYEQFQSQWETLMGVTNCTETVSEFNATRPCFVNKSENKVWVRLPHFSGGLDEANGVATTVLGGGGDGDSGSGGGGGGGGGDNIYTKGSESNPLDSDDLNEPYKVLLRYFLPTYIKNDKYDQTHKIELNGIVNGVANITISSDPITLLLSKGNVVKLNLSNKEFYDLRIEIIDIVSGIVTMNLTEISEPHPDYVASSGDGDSGADGSGSGDSGTTSGEGNTGDSSMGSVGRFVFLIVILVIIAVVIFLLYNHFLKGNKGSTRPHSRPPKNKKK